MLRGALKHTTVHLNHITWLSEKLKPLLIGHLAAIKSFMFQKRS